MSRTEQFFKTCKYGDPIFNYKKTGIVLMKEPYKGYNLTENYEEHKFEIIDLLDKIADNGNTHIKIIVKMVKEDLQNGTY